MNFLHKHRVAHRYVDDEARAPALRSSLRDCNPNNIMMDPSTLFPVSFYPTDTHMRRDFANKAERYTRRQRPAKYCIMDFGISRGYKLKTDCSI